MSKREIIILAFKIMAIVVILQSLFALTGLFIQSMSIFNKLLSSGNLSMQTLLGLLPYVAGLLLYLGLGFHLWTMSGSYADKMAREIPTFSEEQKIVPEDIREIAFSVVGIYIIASSIPNAISIMLQGHISAQLITTVVKIGIGFWLLLGSRGIINLIKKARGERFVTEQPPD